MTTISYYQATPSDIPILVEYRLRFVIEYAGEQPTEKVNELKQHLTKYFTKAFANQTCISFIAKSGGIIAGLGVLNIREQPGHFKNPSGKWGYLMGMYTIPEFRKQGICTAILNALLEEGKRMGITAFELHATKEGEAVYLKNGFQFHHEPTLRKYF